MSHPGQIYRPASPGLRNVGSYQVSGHPYISGSHVVKDATAVFRFPYVSKKIKVQVTGACEVDVTFVSTSATGYADAKENYYTVYPVLSQSNGDTPIGLRAEGDFYTYGAANATEFYVKAKEVHITAGIESTGVQVFAELTNINTGSMYPLTGSGVVTLDNLQANLEF